MSTGSNIGNPKKAFQSINSYIFFNTKVTWRNRYIYDDDTQDFLDAVLCTSETRKKELKKDSLFWRAQIGYDTNPENYDMPIPYGYDRMKPKKNKAKEGRANPKGISYLYLATDITTAISEVRPWLSSLISVAKFKLDKSINIIDCSDDKVKNRTYHVDNPDDSMKESYVWSDINDAFSRPVTESDDLAYYTPTQVLADLFKHHNYDGIAYKSSLGNGHNLVIFDSSALSIESCELHQVDNIDINHKPRTFPTYKK